MTGIPLKMKERSTDGQHAAVMSDVAHEGTGLGSGLWRGWVKGTAARYDWSNIEL